MASGCMTIRGQLTRAEEHNLTRWLVWSLDNRSADWTYGQHTVHDRVTGIEVWIANGRGYVAIWRPIQTNIFHFLNRRRVWRAAHQCRHRSHGQAFQHLAELCERAPIIQPIELSAPAAPQLPPPAMAPIEMLRRLTNISA